MCIRILIEKYYERKAQSLIMSDMFDEALEYIKRISSFEKQKEIISANLTTYALRKISENKSDFEVHFTKDRDEYELFKNLVGSSSSVKRVLYINPETDLVEEGMDELVDEVVSPDNVVLKYLDSLQDEVKENK